MIYKGLVKFNYRLSFKQFIWQYERKRASLMCAKVVRKGAFGKFLGAFINALNVDICRLRVCLNK